MKPEKELLLSWAGAAICAVGSVAVCLMGWPAGLFVIIPTAIPHVCRLFRLYRPKKG